MPRKAFQRCNKMSQKYCLVYNGKVKFFFLGRSIEIHNAVFFLTIYLKNEIRGESLRPKRSIIIFQLCQELMRGILGGMLVDYNRVSFIRNGRS